MARRSTEPEDEQDSQQDDEIRPSDGLLRYWLFLNGETYRTFAAIASAFLAILWCFLYFLGLTNGALGTVLLIASAVGFVAWRLLTFQLDHFTRKDWRAEKASPRKEKIEIRIAIALWLFIAIGVSALLSYQWLHRR